ncbi:MAG TPA: hypothetical protein VF002_08980, partial [Gaiellaceae bacterium]
VTVRLASPPPAPPPPRVTAPLTSPPPAPAARSAPVRGALSARASTPHPQRTTGRSSGRAARRRSATKQQALLLDRRHPRTTFVFRLGRAGFVRFFVEDLACGTVQSFTVRGHVGVNRVRFSGRIRGRRLRAGEYRIRGRSHGRTVFRRRLVIAGRRLGCGSSEAARVFAVLGDTDVTGLPPVASAKRASAPRARAGTSVQPQPKRHTSQAGVLGARIIRILPGSGRTQLALLVVLALAIFLLSLGALPRRLVPHPAAAAFLARRRALIAMAGLAALAAFLVSYYVS